MFSSYLIGEKEKLRVLFIDDEPAILEQGKIFLERRDDRLDVETTESAEDGLNMLENDNYDVVVADYKMPGMDGIQLLEKLRTRGDIPFIIFTGKGREEVAMEALNLGANRYLQKGGDLESQYGVLADAIFQVAQLKKLDERLQFLSSIAQQIEDSLVVANADFEIVYVNEATEKLYGYHQKEILGKTPEMLIAESDSEQVQEEIYQTVASGEIWTGSLLNEKKDGSTFFCELKISPFFDDKGEIPFFIGIQRDISERKKRKEELRRSKERFRKFFNELGDAVFVTKVGGEERGKILEVNPTAIEQTGYSREELTSMNIERDLAVSEKTGPDSNRVDERLSEGKSAFFTQRKQRKDGTDYWTEVVVTPIEYEGEKACLSINRDITQLKEAEERKDFLNVLLRQDLRSMSQITAGYLQLLRDATEEDEREFYLKNALRTCKKEINLIDLVNEESKLEEKKSIEEREIGKVLADVSEDNKRLTEEENVDLKIDYQGLKGKVWAGGPSRSLLSNLIDARVYDPECNKIEVCVEDKEDKFLVKMEDDGTKLPGNIREEVFDRNYTGETTGAEGAKLYLIGRIIKNFDFKVKVKDSELGGMRFDISFQKT